MAVKIKVGGKEYEVVGGDFEEILDMIKGFSEAYYDRTRKVWELEQDFATVNTQIEADGLLLVAVEPKPFAFKTKSEAPTPTADLHLERAAHGMVRLSHRLARDQWNSIAAYFRYISDDDAEDMGLWNLPAGWYLTSDDDAPEVERILGIKQEMSLAAQDAHAEEERKLAAQRLIEQEQRDAERKQELTQLGGEYASFRERITAGLVKTTAAPPAFRELHWMLIASYPAGTPGAWYTTGDDWYSAEVADQTVYRYVYGNATLFYATQELVDQWIAAEWQWLVGSVYEGDEAAAARSVLRRYQSGSFGHDVADRLVELRGLNYFLTLARSSEWLIGVANRDHYLKVAQQYDLPYALMTAVPYQEVGSWSVYRHPRTGEPWQERSKGWQRFVPENTH